MAPPYGYPTCCLAGRSVSPRRGSSYTLNRVWDFADGTARPLARPTNSQWVFSHWAQAGKCHEISEGDDTILPLLAAFLALCRDAAMTPACWKIAACSPKLHSTCEGPTVSLMLFIVTLQTRYVPKLFARFRVPKSP